MTSGTGISVTLKLCGCRFDIHMSEDDSIHEVEVLSVCLKMAGERERGVVYSFEYLVV